MVAIKHKVSISVSRETLERVREAVRTGRYRNKSHAFEQAANEVLNE